MLSHEKKATKAPPARTEKTAAKEIVLLSEPGKTTPRMHPDLPCNAGASLAFSGSGFVFSRCRQLLCLPSKGKSHKISMSYKQSKENSDITRSKICKPHCCPICFIQQVLPTGHLSLRRLYFLSPLFFIIVFQISLPGPPVAIRAIKS